MTTRREFLTRTAAACILAPSVTAHAAARKTVQTVLGPIDAAKLGFTLPHEHLCASSAGFWQVWPEYFGGRKKFVEKAVAKLKAARAEGVTTIVDLTTADLGRDIRLMEEVSRKSGMQIVACTGHWLHPSVSMDARSVEELADFFHKEIEHGIEGTKIKAGVIKVATETATPQDPGTLFDDKLLRAAARVSKATGIPIETHTHALNRDGLKQAEIFESEGLQPARVSLGHSDESDDLDYLTGLLKRGYRIGMDHMMYGIPAGAKLPWQKRADCIKTLIDAGFAGQLLLSNDWMFGISVAPTGTQDALEKINPDGLLFNTRKVLPYLQQQGVTAQLIRQMTVDNPRRFFAGV
ncbi:phosphotriesterase family protein [Roseiterribacter gracilis]|uniref:Phosphotriesterase n=1 Tax=Roseiterribacter gracilis TaxID=2812848 RepID=A0A8S8XKT1_9PROT|nr:phosphotriesterase [Rhodospirillales bacterium TMPK1]